MTLRWRSLTARLRWRRTRAATTVDVLANDTDVDNLSGPANAGLSVAAATNGAHGTVTLALGGSSLTYTPNPDFYGTDSFTYTVTDGALTDITTVSVTVSPVTDAPVAQADSATVAEDSSPSASTCWRTTPTPTT